jgi:hypothetical protein
VADLREILRKRENSAWEPASKPSAILAMTDVAHDLICR